MYVPPVHTRVYTRILGLRIYARMRIRLRSLHVRETMLGTWKLGIWQTVPFYSSTLSRVAQSQ